MTILKYFDWQTKHIQMLILVFIATLLARGGVIFHGYSLDDLTSSFTSNADLMYTQGRYISALISSMFFKIGINPADMYFGLGLIALFMLSVFVISILRFTGLCNLPSSVIVAAIIVTHPYLTEIFTFRLALFNFIVGLTLSLVTLELIIKAGGGWYKNILAIIAALASLFVYQIFLNFLLVITAFTFITAAILKIEKNSASKTYENRAKTLLEICFISTLIFLITIYSFKFFGFFEITERGSFINFSYFYQRINEIKSLLAHIYWKDEPVLNGWLKNLVLLMVVLSTLLISFVLFVKAKIKPYKSFYLKSVFLFPIIILTILLLSPGIILPFREWWPVPRVLCHISIIIGLLFLVSDLLVSDHIGAKFKKIIYAIRFLILIGFIFSSNQILADQQRLNNWDQLKANRILSRLESLPGFENVKFLYIDGGELPYPVNLKTIQGDMNISAFSAPWSKIYLIMEASGYKFENPAADQIDLGKKICSSNSKWPNLESVLIVNSLAIICLKK
jgi:hypothetical protein